MGKKKFAKRPSAAAVAATPANPDEPQFWAKIGLGALLLFAVFLAYSNSFGGPFLLDNQQIILMDTRLRTWDWDHLTAIFTKDYWWPTLASDLYRPITTLTYLINYAVFGNANQPEGYHIVNLLLHMVNVVLVYFVLRQMGTQRLVAYWAAAIFGLHPVATEGVANIVGRADLLVTFFVLSALLCYMHSVRARGWAKFGWLTAQAGLSILGVLSKESGVMILPAMFFYDWLYRSHADQAPLPKSLEGKVNALWPGYAAIVPALLTFLVARIWMMRTSPTYGNPFVDNPIELAPFFEGRMTAFKVLGQYCGMLLWPDRLSCDWSYNQIPLFGPEAPWFENLQSPIAVILVISLFVAAWFARKQSPLLTFGILWFFVAIFPVSNLPITIGSIKGERLLYLPSVGFALIAGMGLERARMWITGIGKSATMELQTVSYGLPLLVFAAFAMRTYVRNIDWSSEYNLWHSAVETCPNSFKTYKGFSNYFIGKGTEEGADQAIATAENGVWVLENPMLPLPRKDNTLYINIGFHYARKAEFCLNRGARDEAMVYFNKALGALDKAMEVDHYANASSRAKFMRQGKAAQDIRDVGNPTVYELRGGVFLGMGDLVRAEEAARYNLRLNPFSASGYGQLAQVYARREDYSRAAVFWLRQLLFDPSVGSSWQNLENAFRILSPDRPGVQRLPNGGYTLLRDNPVAYRLLVQACVDNYQILLDTLHFPEARSFRDKAIQMYGCPPNLLPIVNRE